MQKMCCRMVFNNLDPIFSINRSRYLLIGFQLSALHNYLVKILTIWCFLNILNESGHPVTFKEAAVSYLTSAFCVERSVIKDNLYFLTYSSLFDKFTFFNNGYYGRMRV